MIKYTILLYKKIKKRNETAIDKKNVFSEKSHCLII